MPYDRYLRNRPFLIVKIVQRPARGVKTEIRGWGDNPDNWTALEETSVVDRVSDKLVREASVIIDVMNKSCIVNNVYSDTDKTAITEYYMNKYQNQIAEATDIWLVRRARMARA